MTDVVLVSLLLTFKKIAYCYGASIVGFKVINVGCAQGNDVRSGPYFPVFGLR